MGTGRWSSEKRSGLLFRHRHKRGYDPFSCFEDGWRAETLDFHVFLGPANRHVFWIDNVPGRATVTGMRTQAGAGIAASRFSFTTAARPLISRESGVNSRSGLSTGTLDSGLSTLD